MLERWGLLDSGACSGIEAGKKRKGKVVKGNGMGKGVRREEDKGKARGKEGDEMEGQGHGQEHGRKMCLSEAVARSRGECYLRYLNGAAMVVYGVPVFLAK